MVFVRSPPDSDHPPTLSAIDWETSVEWSSAIPPCIDGPFASLVWSPKGLTGLMFRDDDPSLPIRLDRGEILGVASIGPLHPVTESDSSDHSLVDRTIRRFIALRTRRIRHFSLEVL